MKKLSTVFVIILCITSWALQAQAQEKAGLKAESENKIEIKVTGMTCAGCASHVSKIISDMDGVISQEVKYPGNIAVVTYDPKKTTPKDLIAVIQEQTSYTAEIQKKETDQN